MRPDSVVMTTPTLDNNPGFTQRVEDLAVEQLVPQAPRSRRSNASHRPCSPLARPAHRPASAWQQSLQACIVSSAYRSSLMPKDILQVGPLQRGRISQSRTFAQRKTSQIHRLPFTASFRETSIAQTPCSNTDRDAKMFLSDNFMDNAQRNAGTYGAGENQ
jgi:hypothetical protein